MSDLSRMLDDLYALPQEDTLVTERPEEDTFLSARPEEDTFLTAADEAPTKAPLWASTEALDEAFASWVPGESDGASAFERSLLAETEIEAATETEATEVVAHDDVEQWLVESEPVLEPVPAGLPSWSPSDDDILPTRRQRRRR